MLRVSRLLTNCTALQAGPTTPVNARWRTLSISIALSVAGGLLRTGAGRNPRGSQALSLDVVCLSADRRPRGSLDESRAATGGGPTGGRTREGGGIEQAKAVKAKADEVTKHNRAHADVEAALRPLSGPNGYPLRPPSRFEGARLVADYQIGELDRAMIVNAGFAWFEDFAKKVRTKSWRRCR